MKKSTYAGLAFVAVVPALLTTYWWSVPLQVFGCAILDDLHIKAGLEKEEAIKLSFGYSMACSIALACATPVWWPVTLLSAIGCHFLGAIATCIMRETFVLPRERRDDALVARTDRTEGRR